MEQVISYRHNVIKMDSLETFCSVRGGMTQSCRDVSFVRAIGECGNFANRVYQAEQRLQEDMQSGRLKYIRIQSLPRFADPEAVAEYSRIYENWKEKGSCFLLHLKEEPLQRSMTAALQKVLAEYQKARPAASESMMKNFGVKLLFWTDTVLVDFLRGWTPKSCRKLMAENVSREQEYLFYYFVTLLGCDVLLLQNKKDVDAAERLKQLSQTLLLGTFGVSELVPYNETVKTTVSEHTPGKHTQQETHAETVRLDASRVKKQPRTVPAQAQSLEAVSTGRQEKSFEELARLASSVVMIAVHDESGEVTGTGSGIMIGKKGFILTNHHVIAGGRFYSVRIEDDEQIYSTGEVIKDNYHLDLAVIRIQRSLEPIPLYKGPQKLVRGQKVVAIGSPLGMFNSVSDGIVSGFRKIDEVDMIQFTAPTSPGSSGGAVLNMYGEVIGISTAGMDRGQNINLAVRWEDICSFARGFYE